MLQILFFLLPDTQLHQTVHKWRAWKHPGVKHGQQSRTQSFNSEQKDLCFCHICVLIELKWRVKKKHRKQMKKLEPNLICEPKNGGTRTNLTQGHCRFLWCPLSISLFPGSIYLLIISFLSWSLLIPGTMAVSCQHHTSSPDHLGNRTSVLMRSLTETSLAEQDSSPDIHLSASGCGFDCLVLFCCCLCVFLSQLTSLVLPLLV